MSKQLENRDSHKGYLFVIDIFSALFFNKFILHLRFLSNIIKELLLNLVISSLSKSILSQEILALRLTVLLDNC